MKIRNGFVSNSSTSSFIVVLKDANKTSTKIQIEIDLATYGKVITTIPDLDKFYFDKYDFNPLDPNRDRITEKNYNILKSAIEKSVNSAVIIGSFSNEESNVEGVLCDMGLNDLVKDENIKVIQGEGGF